MSIVDGDRPYEGTIPTYETCHDFDGAASLSETVIDAIATAEGVDPMSFDLELYEAVDLEALDALFDRRSPDGHWRFEFSVESYLVVVAGDGNVSVCENADASEDSPARNADATEAPDASESAGTPDG
jgi:hypothetical protein